MHTISKCSTTRHSILLHPKTIWGKTVKGKRRQANTPTRIWSEILFIHIPQTSVNGKGLHYVHIKEHTAHQGNWQHTWSFSKLLPRYSLLQLKKGRLVEQSCCSYLFIWSLPNAACYRATYSFGMSKLVKSMNPFLLIHTRTLPVLVVALQYYRGLEGIKHYHSISSQNWIKWRPKLSNSNYILGLLALVAMVLEIWKFSPFLIS